MPDQNGFRADFNRRILTHGSTCRDRLRSTIWDQLYLRVKYIFTKLKIKFDPLSFHIDAEEGVILVLHYVFSQIPLYLCSALGEKIKGKNYHKHLFTIFCQL